MPAVAFQPHSCKCCEKLVIRGTHTDQYVRHDVTSDKILFDFTLRDLRDGVAQGCKLCQWILSAEAISRHGYADLNPRTSNSDSPVDVGTYEVMCSVFDKDVDFHRSTLLEAALEGGDTAEDYTLLAATSPPFKMAIGYMSDVHSIQYFGLWDPKSKMIRCRTQNGLQSFAESGDPAMNEVSTRPVESSLQVALPAISLWLKECHHHHAKCRSMAKAVGGSGAKPLRLLHVETSGGPFRVHIQETKGLPVFPQYVALSYCWGGDQPVKLTTDTLAKFKVSIPVATLPLTLQDAVSVCVRLGYNYLWIDALCILQNSNTEKATEIAKMPFIYGRADVTITASRAGSVGEGFLHSRIPDSAKRSAFALPCVCSNGEVGKINLVDLATDPEPIESRGWTFQERLLSPRIVEFGSRQTRWTCQEDRYSDGITDGWRNEVEWSPTKLQLTTLRHSLSASDGPDIGMWYHLVNIYCERKLTQNSDRPLAISGVAEWFGTLVDDEYLAGIWKSHIHTGLLWAVPPLERLKHPQTFQGPSWSWLSVSSPIWVHYVHYKSWEPENLRVNLLSSTITLQNALARFGAVEEGTGVLTLEGRLALAEVYDLKTLRPDGNEIAYHDHEVKIFGRTIAGECNGLAAFYPDCEEVVQLIKGNNKMDVMALEILSMHEGPTWSSYGLVLQRRVDKVGGSAQTTPTFSRLGTFVFEVTGDNCQQDDESDEEWEERIQMELNWFKDLDCTILDLV